MFDFSVSGFKQVEETHLPAGFATAVEELSILGDRVVERLHAVNSGKWQPIADFWKRRENAIEVSSVA